MHSPQIDLLSYAYIRTEVERLFKAYLDARLIELAEANKEKPFEYWDGVLQILDSIFGWRRADSKAADKAPGKAAGKTADEAADSEDSIDVLLQQLKSKTSGINESGHVAVPVLVRRASRLLVSSRGKLDEPR